MPPIHLSISTRKRTTIRTSVATCHTTHHRTSHTTYHLATFSTIFLRASFSRNNRPVANGIRPKANHESGDREWLFAHHQHHAEAGLATGHALVRLGDAVQRVGLVHRPHAALGAEVQRVL